MAKREEYTKAEQQWIAETRLRLAQRRGKKPGTKAGQIRALWPEIRTAIADGQSLASIRQWLEEEGGVHVTVQSLGSYLTRIRRKDLAKAATVTPPAAQPLVEAKLPSTPNPPANDSGKRQEKSTDLNILPGRPTKAS